MSRMQDVIKALADEVHYEDGWLSDAQEARLHYNESNLSVEFCGEGSIDLAHLVGIVEAVVTKGGAA